MSQPAPAPNNTPPEAQKNADAVYNAVKTAIGTGRVTVASVMIMITTAMVEVEKFTALTGPQKKQLVIHVVDRLIEEIPATQEDKAAIKSAVDLFMPCVVDTVIAVSKSQLAINVKHRISQLGAEITNIISGVGAAPPAGSSSKCCAIL